MDGTCAPAYENAMSVHERRFTKAEKVKIKTFFAGKGRIDPVLWKQLQEGVRQAEQVIHEPKNLAFLSEHLGRKVTRMPLKEVLRMVRAWTGGSMSQRSFRKMTPTTMRYDFAAWFEGFKLRLKRSRREKLPRSAARERHRQHLKDAKRRQILENYTAERLHMWTPPGPSGKRPFALAAGRGSPLKVSRIPEIMDEFVYATLERALEMDPDLYEHVDRPSDGEPMVVLPSAQRTIRAAIDQLGHPKKGTALFAPYMEEFQQDQEYSTGGWADTRSRLAPTERSRVDRLVDRMFELAEHDETLAELIDIRTTPLHELRKREGWTPAQAHEVHAEAERRIKARVREHFVGEEGEDVTVQAPVYGRGAAPYVGD